MIFEVGAVRRPVSETSKAVRRSCTNAKGRVGERRMAKHGIEDDDENDDEDDHKRPSRPTRPKASLRNATVVINIFARKG